MKLRFCKDCVHWREQCRFGFLYRDVDSVNGTSDDLKIKVQDNTGFRCEEYKNKIWRTDNSLEQSKWCLWFNVIVTAVVAILWLATLLAYLFGQGSGVGWLLGPTVISSISWIIFAARTGHLYEVVESEDYKTAKALCKFGLKGK